MGFEVVVRPVVLPDFRPRPAQSLPPADDPEKGFAVIRGNGYRQASTSRSVSVSSSQSRPTETKRRVDEVRVYQKDKNQKINKENYIDLEVANKIWMTGGAGPSAKKDAEDPLESGNTALEKQINFYERAFSGDAPPDNIEILKKDVIKTSKSAG